MGGRSRGPALSEVAHPVVGSLLYIRVRGVSARYQHFMLMPEGIKGGRKAEAGKQSVV